MMNFNAEQYHAQNSYPHQTGYAEQPRGYAPKPKPQMDFETKEDKSSGGGFMNFIMSLTVTLLLAALVMEMITYYLKWKKGLKPKETKLEVQKDGLQEASNADLIFELFKRGNNIKLKEQATDPETAHRQFRDATLNSMQENDDDFVDRQIGFMFSSSNDDTDTNNGQQGAEGEDN